MMTEEIFLASLLQIGVPHRALKYLYQIFHSYEGVWTSPIHEFPPLQLPNEDAVLTRECLYRRDDEVLVQVRQRLQDHGIQVLLRSSNSYPLLLQEISAAPQYLFVKGGVAALSARTPLAVVGTRRMSEYGDRVLHELIPPLVQAGVTIVSGLAYGIDALAHEITLDCGGVCVAVFGCGVDRVYPSQNRRLAERILQHGGALVSERPLGTEPRPEFFPARNRIISGLSKATLVVEAQEKSGSLITAQFALEQNRDVYAVPGDIFGSHQAGTNRLVAEGAIPVLNAEQLLESLQLSEQISTPALLQFGTEQEKSLYLALQQGRSLDELAKICQLGSAQLNRMVMSMQLKGLVRELGLGRYIRV